MKARLALFLVASHLIAAALGFAGGIYTLPLLIAPAAPSLADLEQAKAQSKYTAQFKRDLKDSDALHWGEGTVSIAPDAIAFAGKLAPGPDYKLYLSPEFVETEVDFKRKKAQMVRVGDVKTFDNFVVAVPAGVDPDDYSSVIVRCETFNEFITAAKYR